MVKHGVKIVIIEDELLNMQMLQKMLATVDQNIEIVGRLQSVQESIDWLSTNPMPDVIFMDIQLTDGLSFEIFPKVEITAPIIFTTAYDSYALKAFEVDGVDYLLKPLELDKLTKAYNKALAHRMQLPTEYLIEQMSSIMRGNISYRSRFLVSQRDKYFVILTEQIAYFKIEDRGIAIITNESKKYYINQTLDMLEKELDPHYFFRLTRQYIISLHAIGKIHQYFNGQLKMEIVPLEEEAIVVSRAKSSQLKKWLSQSTDHEQ